MAVQNINMTCIICPRGCTLNATVDNNGEINVAGNMCARGKKYAVNELTCPMRTLTGTVITKKGGVLPVKSEKEIPKKYLLKCAHNLANVKADDNIMPGDTILDNILSFDSDEEPVRLISTGKISY